VLCIGCVFVMGEMFLLIMVVIIDYDILWVICGICEKWMCYVYF